jgi:hypothetical protein
MRAACQKPVCMPDLPRAPVSQVECGQGRTEPRYVRVMSAPSGTYSPAKLLSIIRPATKPINRRTAVTADGYEPAHRPADWPVPLPVKRSSAVSHNWPVRVTAGENPARRSGVARSVRIVELEKPAGRGRIAPPGYAGLRPGRPPVALRPK